MDGNETGDRNGARSREKAFPKKDGRSCHRRPWLDTYFGGGCFPRYWNDRALFLLVSIMTFFLSGCGGTIEGGGFYNSGRPSVPVVCEEITPIRIECRTIKNGFNPKRKTRDYR